MERAVIGIGQRERVEMGGRAYVLRPISYGEAAGLAAEEAAAFQESTASAPPAPNAWLYLAGLIANFTPAEAAMALGQVWQKARGMVGAL